MRPITAARASRRRLALQTLEDRTAPAFTLAINGDATTVGVSSVFADGTTTFTASANGATLDVDDIEAAFVNGDVVITTGSGGSQSGNIDWSANSVTDDLDYPGSAVRTLTLRPDSSSTGGGVATALTRFNFNDNVHLVIDTTAPATDGAILLVSGTQINSARSVTLNAGTGVVAIDSASVNPMAASGDISITGGSFHSNNGAFVLRSDQGNVTINAAIQSTPVPISVRAELGTVTLNGPVDGGSDLSLYGRDIAINAPIGATTPLNSLTFAGGDVSFGANSIEADDIFVGDASFDPFEAALGAGTGTVTGNVLVQFDGDIAPGGAGTVGTLTIDGDLTFDGGDYALDLGATSDNVVVDGSVSIDFGRLGTETSTGALTGPGDVQVISATGSLTGEFFNAPVEFPVVVGGDAILATNYASGPGGMTVAQVPAAVGGKATGFDIDGTAYTIRLTGGGQLVVFTDQGQVNVITRNTTPLSRVAVTTKVNASDDVVAIGPVRINGPLAAFAAAKADLTGDFTATGLVKSVTFANVVSPISLAGTGKTAVKAETFFSDLTTTGGLSSLTTTGDFLGSVTAGSIGRVKVGGILMGSGQPWQVANGIASLVAPRVESFELNAKFVGTMNVTGSLLKHIAGDLANSTIRLTGDDGTAGRFGLKTLTVKGNVINSSILVEEGNVSAVTVGRFASSRLYLDYSPTGDFHLGGDFGSQGNFKLTKFTTTALTLGDPLHPLDYAFFDSQVVADTIGTVRLSGLLTAGFGQAFGFKFRTAGGSVQAKTADDDAVPLITNLQAAGAPIAGDFYFLDV